MALNLSRNTRLFVSTVSTGNVAADTWEVPVLDGYTFSQDAASQTVTLNEAGDAPVRGQKIFNTALNPAEISFPTYIRPFFASSNHNAVEKMLWEGLIGPGPADYYAKAGTNYMEANFKGSNQHELLSLYLFFQLENTTYRIDSVALNTAEIDFSIDAIAQITWTGQGLSITEVDTSTWAAGVDYTAIDSGALFIKNKLSSISLKKTTTSVSEDWVVDYGNALVGSGAHTLAATTAYTVDITIDGGSTQTITIDTTTFTGAGTTTIQNVIDEINYQLDGGVAYIEETGTNIGDLIIVSSTAGTTSSITVVDGVTNALMATLDTVNYVSIGAEGTTGSGTPTVYNVPITGGSLTIDNGITYLTPEELGVVNTPLGSFTGARAISGSITAYLNTGTNNTAGLLSDLASDTSTVTQEFEMTMSVGGGANTPRADFIMNHAHLVIPSFTVEDVLSTEINFTALGERISNNDELIVRYYAQ